jgi:pyrimidine-nucleoside phosphorylase
VPLISASVMSKKLAEGADAIVLDVKCGRGAFMKSVQEATRLARSLVDIGKHAGVPTEALITRMDVPLGRTVGNALEVAECVAVLRGRGPEDLTDVLVQIAVRMLVVSGRYTLEAAEPAVHAALASGAALEKLRAMIARQGGDPGIVDDETRLPVARHRRAVVASRSGFVSGLDAEEIGRASMLLGAGRQRVDDVIDHATGIVIVTPTGAAITVGETVLELHYNDDRRLAEAEALARGAIAVADAPPVVEPAILGAVL